MAESRSPGIVNDEDTDRLAGTNLENYGSAEHKALREKAAQGERAWDGVKELEEGTKVWRINKFNVENWPEQEYGQFFNGDSYIVLNAYKEEEQTLYNVHFWLGSETTQDEAGTAAYKTVELDDLLGDLPVQYREVEGHESKEFRSLFPTGIKLLQGGAETGFRHVEPNAVDYKPRLLRMKKEGKKQAMCKQVPLSVDELSMTDCFILDTPGTTYQFRPESASVWEKRLANTVVEEIFDMRNGRVKKTAIDWGDETPESAEFWEFFGGVPESLPEQSNTDKKKAEEEEMLSNHVNKLYKVSDQGNAVGFEEIASGVLNAEEVNGKEHDSDVLIVDVGRVVFVWLGPSCSSTERAEAQMMATKLLTSTGRPFWTPVIRVCDGKEPKKFWRVFGCEQCPADI